ncbi:MAG: VanZ family protein [Oscillospiraceae bacterium]|nr:VanZ family protein [Oscillospiraceae bacterium]
MFEISFLSVEIAFSAVWLLVRIVIWKRQNRIDWKREAVLLLMYLNLAVIIRFVFFPRDLVDGRIQPLIFEAATVFPLRINLIPLVHLFDYDSIQDIIWNVVGNAVLFIPSGIVLPIIYRQLNKFWKVVATGVFISLCTEILQLPFPSRASDIDDLILNTLGVSVGYGIYAACKRLKR